MRTAADIRINKVFDFDFSILQAHHVLHPLRLPLIPPPSPNRTHFPYLQLLLVNTNNRVVNKGQGWDFSCSSSYEYNHIYDPNKQNQKNFLAV